MLSVPSTPKKNFIEDTKENTENEIVLKTSTGDIFGSLLTPENESFIQRMSYDRPDTSDANIYESKSE